MGVRYRFYSLLILISGCYDITLAQNITASTIGSDSAESRQFKSYVSQRNENLLLFNGTEYVYSYSGLIGHPFYLSDTFRSGTLEYDHVLYSDVVMAYDILNDVVVVKNSSRFFIRLVPEKINSFRIGAHLFVTISASDLSSDVMRAGIYEAILYDSASLFVKHEKLIQRGSDPKDPDHFTRYDYYFIQKGNQFFTVKNGNALFTIFRDKSSELRVYMRQNNLDFKKDPDTFLRKAIAYYTQLKN